MNNFSIASKFKNNSFFPKLFGKRFIVNKVVYGLVNTSFTLNKKTVPLNIHNYSCCLVPVGAKRGIYNWEFALGIKITRLGTHSSSNITVEVQKAAAATPSAHPSTCQQLLIPSEATQFPFNKRGLFMSMTQTVVEPQIN